MKLKWIFLLLAVALVCAGCSLIPKEAELPLAPVADIIEPVEPSLTPVERGDIIEEQTFSCKYEPAEEEQLFFPQNGQVVSAIYVKKGDTVKAGDLIAELDNTDVLKSISDQQRQVTSLQVQVNQEYELISVLDERIKIYTESAGGDPDLYQAEIASIQQARAARTEQLTYLQSLLYIERTRLSELENSLKNRQLFAGIDGTVSYALELTDKVMYSSSTKIVCVIMDLSGSSFVKEFEEDYFAEGDTVNLVINDVDHEAYVQSVTVIGEAPAEETEVTGETEATEAAEDENTETEAEETEPEEDNRSYLVHFSLATPDPTLKVGAVGKLTLLVNARYDVLYLPLSAVHQQGDNCFVYYLDENGFMAAKNVEIGMKANDRVEIISGLKDGDEVIY